MKVTKENKIEKCVADDRHNPKLQNVWLNVDGDNSTLIATNGRIMAKIPVTVEEGDVSGFITGDALQAARKLAKNGRTAQIHANGALAVANGPTFARPDGEYIQWDHVWPKGEAKFKFSINVKNLVRVADALGEENIELEFVDDKLALRVNPYSGKTGAALIMPLIAKK